MANLKKYNDVLKLFVIFLTFIFNTSRGNNRLQFVIYGQVEFLKLEKKKNIDI